MQQMQVTVPPGVYAGMSFQVNTPAGPMEVVAPVGEGQQMIVNVPAAPVVMATVIPDGGAPMMMATSAAPQMAPVQQSMHRTVPIGSIPAGGSQPLWSAQELTGTWICCCLPGGCGITTLTAEGDDVKIENGVCCFLGLPCPISNERWIRKGDTNGFYKDDEPSSVDVFTSRTSICNGPSCSRRLC